MPDDPNLAELAARGRERRNNQRPPERRSKRSKPSARQQLIRRSLAGNQGIWLLLLGALVAAPWLIYELADLEGIGLSPTVQLAILTGFTLTCAVLGAIWLRRSTELAAARERKRLRAHPLNLDVDAYLDILGTSRKTTQVAVRAQFRAGINGEQAKVIADAAHGILHEGRAKCSNTALTLESETLATWVPSSGDRDSYYSNRKVHAWVSKGLVVLLRIHQDHPIARVTFE